MKVDISTFDELSTGGMRHLPTGLPSLDKCLRGEIRVGAVTELVGPAGTGKTQLALQLSTMMLNYNQRSLYIDTGN